MHNDEVEVTIRLPRDQLRAVTEWADVQADKPPLNEAIRRLLWKGCTPTLEDILNAAAQMARDGEA